MNRWIGVVLGISALWGACSRSGPGGADALCPQEVLQAWERVAREPEMVKRKGLVRVRVDVPCRYPLLFVDGCLYLISPMAPPYGVALVAWDRVGGQRCPDVGHEGQGPGEWTCWPTVGRDERGLWVLSIGKISWFDGAGRLLEERKLPLDLGGLLPLARGWVASCNTMPSEENLRQDPFHQEKVWITLDQDLEHRSEVLKTKGRVLESYDFSKGKRLICGPTSDYNTLLRVWEGRAYVGDSETGRIHVLDGRGRLQETLVLPWPQRPVLPGEAQAMEHRNKDWCEQAEMAWHTYETWPAFFSLHVTDGSIWCLLFPREGWRDLVELGLDGVPRKVYRLLDDPAFERQGGYCIHKGSVFLLEDSGESWAIREIPLGENGAPGSRDGGVQTPTTGEDE